VGLRVGLEGTENLAPTMMRFPHTYKRLVLLILEERIIII